MRRAFDVFLTLLLACLAFAVLSKAVQYAHGAATLLPNGEQCFQTSTGPVSSGSINMYTPATTTPKTTWQNANQSTPNTQPIQLDANGCAIIYGAGSYRQQLFSGPVVGGVTSGNLIFDLTTTDTSASNVFWAGTATGTPNAITITDPGFSAVDGSVIAFIPISTNTNAVTLNPSGFGAINIVKDTSTGPTALAGGEIVCAATCNTLEVIYRASDNQFHILNFLAPGSAVSTMCGASGYTQVNGASPNTQITVNATQLVLLTSGGASLLRTSISPITIDITASGVNGLDTGAVSPSNIYHVWLIDNGTAPAGLFSLSATSPVMPNGYTYKCRLASLFTDVNTHVAQITTQGNATHFTAAYANTNGIVTFTLTGAAGTCSANTFVSKTIALLPTTAVRAIGVVRATATNSAGIAGGTSPGPFEIWAMILNQASSSEYLQFRVPLSTSQTIFICNSGGEIDVFGWEDGANVH